MGRKDGNGNNRSAAGASAGRFALKLKSDQALMQLTREGYELAFEELVERHRPRLTRLAKRLVGDNSASDVLQHALIAAHRLIEDQNSDLDAINIEAWLMRTVRNRGIDILRRQSHLVASEDPCRDRVTSETAAGVAQTRSELADLTAHIKRLPERQQQVLLQREFEGRTYDEIAESLGITTGAVNQLLIRARTTLRNGVGLLLPLPLVRAIVYPNRFEWLQERLAPLAAAPSSLGGGAKTAAVVVTAVAVVAGSQAIDRSEQRDKQSDPAVHAQRSRDTQHPEPTMRAASHVRHPAAKQRPDTGGETEPNAPTPSRDNATDGEPTPADREDVGKGAPGHVESGTPGPDDTRDENRVRPPVARITLSPSGTWLRSDIHVDRPELIVEPTTDATAIDIAVERTANDFAIVERDGAAIALDEQTAKLCTRDGADSRMKCSPQYDGRLSGVTVRGGGAGDRLQAIATGAQTAGFSSVILIGGAGDDTVLGGPDPDWLAGGLGNDQLNGGEGDDLVDGGWGFIAGNADDGNDIARGGSGRDWMFGDSGDDLLDGGPGDDHLQGMGGDDVLDGGPGEDFASGKAGRDTFDLRDGEKDYQPCAQSADHLVIDDGLDAIGPDWTNTC